MKQRQRFFVFCPVCIHQIVQLVGQLSDIRLRSCQIVLRDADNGGQLLFFFLSGQSRNRTTRFIDHSACRADRSFVLHTGFDFPLQTGRFRQIVHVRIWRNLKQPSDKLLIARIFGKDFKPALKRQNMRLLR